MTRPDYIRCIRAPRSNVDGLCGLSGYAFFADVAHAQANRDTSGRLVCCPACLRKAGAGALAEVEEALTA